MTESDPRLANLIGALTLALSDAMRDATETAADHAAAGPSALIALSEFLDHPTIALAILLLVTYVPITGLGLVRLFYG